MIGCPIAVNIFQSYLKMKALDHPSVTLAIRVNPPIGVPIALHIPSSVVPASSLATPIHHSISLSGGMDISSNPLPSWTLASFSILDTVVTLAPQTKPSKVLIWSSVWWIHLASHITDSKHVTVQSQGLCTFNFSRWTFSHQPSNGHTLSSHFLCWIAITLNLWKAKLLQAISTANCGA
jgi:hypothetical protein